MQNCFFTIYLFICFCIIAPAHSQVQNTPWAKGVHSVKKKICGYSKDRKDSTGFVTVEEIVYDLKGFPVKKIKLEEATAQIYESKSGSNVEYTVVSPFYYYNFNRKAFYDTTFFKYGAAMRLKEEFHSDGKDKFLYTYDSKGNLLNKKHYRTGELISWYEWSYDSTGNLINKKEYLSQKKWKKYKLLNKYKYDKAGRKIFSATYAETPFESDSSIYKYYDNYYSVTKYYLVFDVFNHPTPTEHWQKTVFDLNDSLLYENFYRDLFMMDSICIKRNNSGLRILSNETNFTGANGGIYYTNESYSSLGSIESRSYLFNKDTVNFQTWIYDTNNHLAASKYFSKGKLQKQWEYFYDKQGNLIEERFYNKNKDLVERTKWIYYYKK